MSDFLFNWVAATPGFAAPLLLACLGLIVNERAGVLNLGAEGMMACGALAAAATALWAGDAWSGLLGAAAAGALLAAVFGLVTVVLRANQVIAGLVVVALGTGIAGVLGRSYVSQTLPGFASLDAAFLENVPVIGNLLLAQKPLTLLALCLPLTAWWGLFRTTAGLRLRAVGESPATADAAGINVVLVRLVAVVIGGALCGLAGGYLVLASSEVWVEGMIGGRGWIAVGLVIFARWQPGLALLGALLFGAIEALIPRLQALGVDLPIYLLMMMPYLATLGILVLAQLRSRGFSMEPGALGTAYARQDRQ